MDFEVPELRPARYQHITFISLADNRPIPRPVVPFRQRSFGSRSAVLTAHRAGSRRLGREGPEEDCGEKEASTPPLLRWVGGRSRRHVSDCRLTPPSARVRLRRSPPLPACWLWLPPPFSARTFNLCQRVPLTPIEVPELRPARYQHITFISLADNRPIPRPVVPFRQRSFGSRSAVLTANTRQTDIHTYNMCCRDRARVKQQIAVRTSVRITYRVTWDGGNKPQTRGSPMPG